ncbi:hypothetical protein D3C76_1376620 [compost metagenome]
MRKFLRARQTQRFFHCLLVGVGPLAHKVLPRKTPARHQLKHRQPFGQQRRLRQNAEFTRDRFGRLVVNGCAIEQYRAPHRVQQARHCTEQRRFPAAVGPNQHGHFFRWNSEGNIIDDDFFLVASREVFKNQLRLCRVLSHVYANLIKFRINKNKSHSLL